jgi:hypothetical protein
MEDIVCTTHFSSNTIVGDRAKRDAERWALSGRDIADWCHTYAKARNIEHVLMTRAKVVSNIYRVQWRIDLLFWSHGLWPRGLAVEVKGQSEGGSVDEKFPFVVASLKALKRPSGLLIHGDGARQSAIQWVSDNEDANFVTWRSIGALRDYVETGKRVTRNFARTVKVDDDLLAL